MAIKTQLQSLSDDELLHRLTELSGQSRRVEADLVSHIGEVDARRLFAREACSSMFVYAIEVLHLSESEAYMRIAVARASRKYPVLLKMLADGRLHLSGIAKLAPHLTGENCEELVARATHKSKRQIERLLVELKPKPNVATSMRKVPERQSPGRIDVAASESPTSVAADQPRQTHDEQETQLRPDAVAQRPAKTAGSPAAEPEPLSPSTYKVTFTASTELRDKLEKLRALCGVDDLSDAIDAAVTEKLERLEARRFGKTSAPRQSVEEADTSPSSRSRHIPAAVRRAVVARDSERCTFIDAKGRRCSATERLEFHHRKPFAKGGDRSVSNIALTCRTHNVYMAEQDYGLDVMRQYRGGFPERASEPTPVYFARTQFDANATRRDRESSRQRYRATTSLKNPDVPSSYRRFSRSRHSQPRMSSRQHHPGPYPLDTRSDSDRLDRAPPCVATCPIVRSGPGPAISPGKLQHNLLSESRS